MDQTKSILLSRTFWGATLAIAASLAGIAGYTVTPTDQTQALDLLGQIYDVGDRVIAIGGAALAIWGRIKATHKIG